MYYSLLQWCLIILGMKSKTVPSIYMISPFPISNIIWYHFHSGLFRVPRYTKFLPALWPLNLCSHFCFSGFSSYSIQLKPQISVPWTPNQKQSPKCSFSCHPILLLKKTSLQSCYFFFCLFFICVFVIHYPYLTFSAIILPGF